MKRKLLCLPLALLLFFGGCASKAPDAASDSAPTDPGKQQATAAPKTATLPELSATGQETPQPIRLKRFDNIPWLYVDGIGASLTLQENEYIPEDIITYSFDDRITFTGNEEIAASVMENGKNPGLGVRELHSQGVTGAGVNVAVIDQNMLTGHPEFSGKVAAYYDSGTETPSDSGSYHGASVMSLLAGETVGVAPGVKVFYAAAPSWKMDAAYYADCLYWVIGQNAALPDGEKIRVVSVSAAPESGTADYPWYKNGEQWDEAVKAALDAGIMVIDCCGASLYAGETGFVYTSYCDPSDPEDVTKCAPGYPDNPLTAVSFNMQSSICAPASYRTLAQEYVRGEYQYRYDGVGGRSWAVPYVAGVLALGWQVNPDLDSETMKSLLLETAWVDDLGLHYVNPPAFIEAVRSK